MIQLAAEEASALRYQFGTLKRGQFDAIRQRSSAIREIRTIRDKFFLSSQFGRIGIGNVQNLTIGSLGLRAAEI